MNLKPVSFAGRLEQVVLTSVAVFSLTIAAHGNPLDVTYSVSGSAGAWVLDFSVTNNLGGQNNVYLFGVHLASRDIFYSPANWTPNETVTLNTSTLGGSDICTTTFGKIPFLGAFRGYHPVPLLATLNRWIRTPLLRQPSLGSRSQPMALIQGRTISTVPTIPDSKV